MPDREDCGRSPRGGSDYAVRPVRLAAMLAAIILAIVLAVAAAILLELVKRPFLSTLAWAR